MEVCLNQLFFVQHTIKGANVRVTSAKGEAKGGDDRKRRKERPNTNNAGEGTEGTHKKVIVKSNSNCFDLTALLG